MIAQAPSNQAFQPMQPYLFSVAYRMTGSASDAEDLVQDAWIRYLDAGSPEVGSLRAWLTTTVSRLALDYLKSARVRRERYSGSWLPEPVLTSAAIGGPEETIEQREEVSLALLTLLERLTPEQRVVYVLREGFGLPYEDIAEHLDKSAAACRQIFRRAQGRVDGERQPSVAPDGAHAELAERFLLAVQSGDAAKVAELLAEDVVWIGDGGGRRLAQRQPILGVDKVSRGWVGLGRKARATMDLTVDLLDLNGAPAALMQDGGRIEQVLAFDIRNGKIATIRVVRNPDKLRHLARVLDIPLIEADEEIFSPSRR